MLSRTLPVVTFVLIAAIAPLAQNPAPPPPSIRLPGITGADHPLSPEEVRREKQMAKERAKERYIEMRRDSARLLELATELKKDVDSAGTSTLSLDVIKKADAIEKLAKSVKQRMKGE